MISVPFFRPDIGEAEIAEVVSALRSGWLTTGPRVKRFEAAMAESVGARHAIAVNSCTAALHLAVEALGLNAEQAVLVPTLTFSATAEVVRYQGAVPVLVDCDATTLNIDFADAARKLHDIRDGRFNSALDGRRVTGVIPVHVGGVVVNPETTKRFAIEQGLWTVEDAAHAFPAAWRPSENEPWRYCGNGTAAVTCFSFYANKTITTGEGGMALTDDDELADRMRLMSLHGLSGDAWRRYKRGGQWDYQILAPGFKYNMTDIAAAMGIHQHAKAEKMRQRREELALTMVKELGHLDEIELPLVPTNRIHSWHLFPIRLRLEGLTRDRDTFIEELNRSGIGTSVHWRPLHLHPYYRDTYGWTPDDCPVATREWKRLVSLPLFPSMTSEECGHVTKVVTDLCRRFRKARGTAVGGARVRPRTLRSASLGPTTPGIRDDT